MTAAARLRITLVETPGRPWRVLDVPESLALSGVHKAIQAAFLWADYHLYEFRIGAKRYGPDAEYGDYRVYRADGRSLGDVIREGVHSFTYLYDFGDEWLHQIDIIDRFDSHASLLLPRFVEGARRAPPEDVGGPFGFEEFLAAMVDPRHRDHAERRDWYGEGFDPDDVNIEAVEAALLRVARRLRR
ncbi:MAG: plasmid pRiA4b ORF-3 family protein [Oceanicaulis sp.]